MALTSHYYYFEGLQRSLSELISAIGYRTSFIPFPLCITQCSFWCFRSHSGHWSLLGEVSKLLIRWLLTQKVSQLKFWSCTNSHTKQGCQIRLQGVSLPNSNLRFYEKNAQQPPPTHTHTNGKCQSKVINSFPSTFALQRMPWDNILGAQMTDE